jgi:hypothetical protein
MLYSKLFLVTKKKSQTQQPMNNANPGGYSGYPPVYGYNPYYQFGYNQFQQQSAQQLHNQQKFVEQLQSEQQIRQSNSAAIKPQKPFGIVRSAKIDSNTPEDVRKHFKQSESEDKQLAAVVKAAQQAKANREVRVEEPQVSQIVGMSPNFNLKLFHNNQTAQLQKNVMPNPYGFPYPPPFAPMSFVQPNQFKIDTNHMQLIPMSLPGGGIDPNIMEQLQSGAPLIDMTNARIIPMSLNNNKIPKTRPTESQTMEE